MGRGRPRTYCSSECRREAEGDALHHAFNIERECELKGSGDEPAVVYAGTGR